MIRVVEKYHDYQATSYYIDPEKLDPDNFVDSEILKTLQESPDADQLKVWIDAQNWESDPKFKAEKYAEPHVSGAAKVTGQKIEDKLIWLTIQFE